MLALERRKNIKKFEKGVSKHVYLIHTFFDVLRAKTRAIPARNSCLVPFGCQVGDMEAILGSPGLTFGAKTSPLGAPGGTLPPWSAPSWRPGNLDKRDLSLVKVLGVHLGAHLASSRPSSGEHHLKKRLLLNSPSEGKNIGKT